MAAEELLWAQELQKAQQRRRAVPANDGRTKKTIEDELRQSKFHLLTALRKNNPGLIRFYAKKLIMARADLLLFTLAELKEQYGTVRETIIKKHLHQYYADCYRLTYALGPYLSHD